MALPLGTIFVLSGLPKVWHRRQFVLTVMEYQVLPPHLSRLYGLIVPPLEILVGLLLLGGVTVRLASGMAAILLSTFVVAVSTNVVRGRRLDCGCLGGLLERRIGPALLVQDLILLGAALFLVVWSRGWVGASGWSLFHLGAPVGAANGLPLAGCALLAFSVSITAPCWEVAGGSGGEQS